VRLRRQGSRRRHAASYRVSPFVFESCDVSVRTGRRYDRSERRWIRAVSFAPRRQLHSFSPFACCYAEDACAIADDKNDDLHVDVDTDAHVPLPFVFVCAAIRPGAGAFESVGLLKDVYVLPGSTPID
jgi:hypothetical protein